VRRWCTRMGILLGLFIRPLPTAAQEPFTVLNMENGTLNPRPVADSTTAPAAASRPDSNANRPAFQIDAGYHTPPMHPYFRDEYRIIQDMRRLVMFIHHQAIHGYESVPELFAIARRFTPAQQTELLEAAVAGSIANFASEVVSLHLRRKKMQFVQWELERVVLRGTSPYVHATFYQGWRIKGIGGDLPSLRLSFAKQSTPYYNTESLMWWPLRRVGFLYARFNKNTILAPIVSSPVGTFYVSYDKTADLIMSAYEFRRAGSVIIRIMHVNNRRVANADRVRSEVILRW